MYFLSLHVIVGNNQNTQRPRRSQAKTVTRKDFRRIEYMVRQGRHNLKYIEMPTTKSVR